MIFGNICSRQNELDELQANVNYMHEYRNASILAFTETWLDDVMDNDELAIDGFTKPFPVDRDKLKTGKKCGGGVCVY